MTMAYAADDYPEDGTYRRLDRGEEEQLVQRLYYRQVDLAATREQQRQEEFDRMRTLRQKVIPKEEEDKLVNRMYDQQLQRMAMSKAEREKKMEAEQKRNDKKIDASEMEDQVRRMYDDEIARHKQRRTELQKRFAPKNEAKKLTKSELGECVTRLYKDDWEKRDEELFKKYVYPNDPKVATISKDEVAEMANRLSTKGG